MDVLVTHRLFKYAIMVVHVTHRLFKYPIMAVLVTQTFQISWFGCSCDTQIFKIP